MSLLGMATAVVTKTHKVIEESSQEDSPFKQAKAYNSNPMESSNLEGKIECMLENWAVLQSEDLFDETTHNSQAKRLQELCASGNMDELTAEIEFMMSDHAGRIDWLEQ